MTISEDQQNYGMKNIENWEKYLETTIPAKVITAINQNMNLVFRFSAAIASPSSAILLVMVVNPFLFLSILYPFLSSSVLTTVYFCFYISMMVFGIVKTYSISRFKRSFY